MTRKLVALRLKALWAGLMAQAHKKGKNGKGMTLVLAGLLLYALFAFSMMMGITFHSMAVPFHQLGLDWLYFSIASIMALGFSVFGSVFSTQSQLYDAKDNALLLSMPIPPSKILMSRMIPLLLINLVFTSIVMIPAISVYAIWVEFRLSWVLLQLSAVLAVTLISQAISCVFGWLLHLMLSRLNKTIASVLYLGAFLFVYFYLISNAQNILLGMLNYSAAIADTLSTWVWPVYAMGQSSIGSFLHAPVLPAVGCILFSIVYLILSATFIKSATRTQAAAKKRQLNLSKAKQSAPCAAVIRKELHKFLRTPIYLTNMGFGILLLAVMTVAGILFKNDILAILTLLPELSNDIPLLILAVISFMVSTIAISTPSVSLEGKNIWILKALPICSKDILLAKLSFHCRLAIPLPILAGGVLAAVYNCNALEILLCCIIPGLLAFFNGVLGLVAGLKWAQLDYISEIYPCKQSVSVLVSMLGTMGLCLLMGVGCYCLTDYLTIPVLMTIITLILGVFDAVLYKLLITWGPQKWDSL